MKIAAVIPAYNEAASIRQITEQVLQYINHVIVVDDGSNDATAEHVADLPVALLCNETNRGKAASLLRAFAHAESLNVDAIITIDADTQHNPHDIPKFIAAMQNYPNHIVIGARLVNHHQAPKIRRWANKSADFFVSWAAGQKILDSQSGYRLYPMPLVKRCLHMNATRASFVFESEVLINSIRYGFPPAIVTIASHYPKNARQSHYRPIKDTVKIGWMLMRKIFMRGLCLPGLYRTLFGPDLKIV